MRQFTKEEKELITSKLLENGEFKGNGIDCAIPVYGKRPSQSNILDCSLEIIRRGIFTIVTLKPTDPKRQQVVGISRLSDDDTDDIIIGVNRAFGKAIHSLNRRYNNKRINNVLAG